MKTNKKVSALGTALLLAVSVGSVYAEEGDMTQTRSQDRIHKEINVQTPDSEQAQIREQKRQQIKQHSRENQQEKAQMRNVYRNDGQLRQNNGAGSMVRNNAAKRSGQGMR